MNFLLLLGIHLETLPTDIFPVQPSMKMQVPIRPEMPTRAGSSKRVSIMSLSPSQRYQGKPLKGAMSRPLTPMYKFPNSPVEPHTPYNSLAGAHHHEKGHTSPVRRTGTPLVEGLTRRLQEWQGDKEEGERRAVPLSPPTPRASTPSSIHELSAKLATSLMFQGNLRWRVFVPTDRRIGPARC